VALAHDILVWSQLLALTDHTARKWEPRTIRLRLMHIPATIARHTHYTAQCRWRRIMWCKNYIDPPSL